MEHTVSGIINDRDVFQSDDNNLLICGSPILPNTLHESISSNIETDINLNLDKNCTGRRIVDIFYIFQQIKNDMHDGGFGCSFMNSELVKEIRNGYYCTWIFKCSMCLITTKIESERTGTYIQVNKATVTASIGIGIGYSQLNEFSAIIDVPCLSSNTYGKLFEQISQNIEQTAWEQMRLAGVEEKRLAIEAGDIDSDGTPLCIVVADGQWGKRSYKTKYDALSGAATIIGFRTNKILFVGIRNRYCCLCERAHALKLTVRDHKCFLNWDKASTGMEADGIAEGFVRSVELHGLKFNRLIGDGDSSVSKRLLELVPYGSHQLVKKIECRNHILRNYSTKLSALTKIIKYPSYLRHIITKNITKFIAAIRKAIQYRKKLDISEADKIKGLKKDILNCPYHIFGQHKNCDVYFCKTPKNIENHVPATEECGMMLEILSILRRVVDNAASLILDVTNNLCEQFNSIINKFIAGKRINFSLKQSYNTRIQAAIISYNTNGNFLRAIHKNVMEKSPVVTCNWSL
ncbi:uncharacterized protein LOC111042410 [Myzus persicae]|uniref:uncharacterized protein LOC111042410 n=2 Tax=Myzus persicae TaxID=13164 RepID=UPI000B9328E2|nr:uncharacterized protein LOC111042410 [Myzus persicae]